MGEEGVIEGEGAVEGVAEDDLVGVGDLVRVMGEGGLEKALGQRAGDVGEQGPEALRK